MWPKEEVKVEQGKTLLWFIMLVLSAGLAHLLCRILQGMPAAASIRVLPSPIPALQQVPLWAYKEPAALPHPAMLLQCQVMHCWVCRWLHAADLM